jgi:protein gp37
VGERSVIEWTDASWNPWRGCDKVDPTCAACYMFRDQRRYGRDPSIVVRAAPATFGAPLSPRWRRRAAEIQAAEGRRMRVFTCSWSDFFHEDADAWRADAWDLVRATPWIDWQILTSRPERIRACLPADWGDGWPHVWLGATIGTRRTCSRTETLRSVPAAVRFVSAEPLLYPLIDEAPEWHDEGSAIAAWEDRAMRLGPPLSLLGIDWLIVGGESGGRPGRRLVDEHNQPIPERLGWVRDLRDRAHVDQVPFLFKQWGGPRPDSAGRHLDGRTHDGFPASAAPMLEVPA